MSQFKYRPTYDLNEDLAVFHQIINLNNKLNEEYHITTVFDDVITDIGEIYNKGIDNEIIYTNWNFNSETQLCNNLCTEDIDIPIYVEIFNQNSKEFSAVYDKEDYPGKIIIQLNRFKIKGNKTRLYACCRHEFLHIREMYATNHNVLKSYKNRIPDNNLVKQFSDSVLNDFFFDIIKNICYLYNNSEKRARLNAVDKFIDSIPDEEILDILNNEELSRSKKKQKFLNLVEDVSLLENMYELYYMIDMQRKLIKPNYGIFEALVYYCNMFGITRHKLKEYHFDQILPKEIYNENDLMIMDKVLQDLIENYKEFSLDILKIIYHNLDKRQLV